jgi:hypothetical protein
MKEKWFIEFTSDFIREFYPYDLDDEGSLRQVAKGGSETRRAIREGD